MSELLDSCFRDVNSIEEIERVDSIPNVNRNYVECWKLSTEIFVSDILTPIVFYIGFGIDFPYSMPSFYFPSLQFGYLPHVESVGGKLCLFEDGTSFDTKNASEMILFCIKKAKRLIKEGVEKENTADFLSEITSYWTRRYNNEPEIKENFFINNSIPTATSVLNAISYAVPISGLKRKDTIVNTLLYCSKEEPFDSYLSRNFDTKNGKVLFVSGFNANHIAPYNLNFAAFLNHLSDKEEQKKVKSFINAHQGGQIFFKLTENRIGGIEVKPVRLQRNGFRNGSLTTCDVYLNFEKKTTNLTRLFGCLYSKERIAERTFGELMQKQNFLIAGLGSIGSNLVHFLNGNNNVSFTLVDKEVLTVDNVGRHLLGYRYVNQFKVCALIDYLQSIRPEQKNNFGITSIQKYIGGNFQKLSEHTALFLCTGDIMTEEYIIDAINKGELTIPVFILWLEPFGAAGHMVYINPNSFHRPLSINDAQTKLYIHNVISDTEYKSQENHFTKRDAGCNGLYALYSDNDVLLMLSAFYPIINRLLTEPEESICYRWVGNIKRIVQKGISVNIAPVEISQGTIQDFPL